MPRPAEVALADGNGGVDLTEVDFTDTVYFYHDYWDSYPEKLYTPADFKSDTVTESPKQLNTEDYRKIEYATHRLELKLPAGVTYGLYTKSSDYSMRIYINGELIDTVGTPTDSKDTTEPRTAERTYYFTPETNTTEIVVQAANWVHREGAYSPDLRIGTAENIDAYGNYKLIIAFLITGGLLTAFLYHLGLFVLNRKRTAMLVFAACCLLLALQMNKLIPLFFPSYNWYIAIGFEYIVHFLTFALLVLFLDMLFSRLYNKYVARVYYGMAGVFILLTFVLQPEVYSNLLIIFDAASLGMVLYTLIRLSMKLKEGKLQNLLAFIGIVLVCLFGVNDILYQNNIHFLGSFAGQQFTTPIAMLFFVFCYGLVISLEYAEIEKKMLAAEHMVLEAEQRYTALLQQSQDTAAPVLPADYNLTQRETDVLWLLLDGKTRQEIADLLFISMGTVNTHCTRIYKKTGRANTADLLRLFGVPEK